MIEASVGKRTTEFWLMVATGVFLLANGTEWINVAPEQVMAWMAAVASFTGLRTWEKRTAIQANSSKAETKNEF